MNLAPFHLNCPFTRNIICYCNDYLPKSDTYRFGQQAKLIYSLYTHANKDFEKEFGSKAYILHKLRVQSQLLQQAEAGVRRRGKSHASNRQRISIAPPSIPTTIQPPNVVNTQQTTSGVRTRGKARKMETQIQQPPVQLPVPQLPPSPLQFPPGTLPALPFLLSAFQNMQKPPLFIKSNTTSTKQETQEKKEEQEKKRKSKSKEETKNAPRTEQPTKKRKRGRPRTRPPEDVCMECGKSYKKDLLQCKRCKELIHTYCHDPPLNHLENKYREEWKCSNCKMCSICSKEGNEDKILLCEYCDRGFHTFCLKPPLDKIPEEAWYCPECSSAKKNKLITEQSKLTTESKESVKEEKNEKPDQSKPEEKPKRRRGRPRKKPKVE